MRKWRRLILLGIGFALAWWLPSLVEIWLSRRSLPAELAWEVQLTGNLSQVALDSEHHVFLTGSHAVKLHGSSGSVLWEQQVSLPHLLAFKGDIYLAGSEARGYRPGPIAPPFSGPNTDFAVSRIQSQDGVVAWRNTFDGGRQDTDWAERLAITTDENPVAAGFTPDDTHYSGCIAKFDARNGKLIWQYRTSEAGVELWHGSSALLAGPTSDVVFASSRKPNEPISSQISFWITRLRGDDGRPVWTAEFPSNGPKSHMLTHLAVTHEGDLVAIGYHAMSRGRNLIAARFSGDDGRLIWSAEQDAESHETIAPTSLVLDVEDNIFVGARSWNGDMTMPLFDRWVLNLSVTDGHRVWAKREAGKPGPWAAGEICSSPKLITGANDLLVCVGSVWNGNNVDVRVDWLSRIDGAVTRSIIYDGAAGNHDLFQDAALTSSGEVDVALRSSRCPEWLKPLREFQYRLKGGPDWRSVHRETSRVDDPDPYNYDSVVWQSRRPAP